MVIRALALGAMAGLALCALGGWAFVKGCPIYDAILENDTHFGF